MALQRLTEYFGGEIITATTVGAARGLVPELLHRLHTVLHRLADIRISDCITNTNVHRNIP